ncbi:Alpha/Beta hydrolase protein [Suillus subaureus]|uniref:Alpha/Beta hydrolase protein n=1 Tax=Suillus subaureus TaxID=48587 RepID=A0A9P7DXF6_9AGAM|nr:Alpha/Beta hydrolase protein [Suillus subaureus]KAG1805674.1 Alpha/Beta hydrolase protein [Suillus subaureus]
MNPIDPQTFDHRTAQISTGRLYHFIDQIPKDYDPTRPPLICLHGFPDSWFGWRHQIGPWCRQGFRVIVPDMLGYGETDMPQNSSAYSTKNICNDISALLDFLAIPKAVVIGHDWGSYTAGRFALWHPDQIHHRRDVPRLSIPYVPPKEQHMSVEEMARKYPSYGYQMYFASESSTSEVEENLVPFLGIVFRTPEKALSWSKLDELITNKQINFTNDCLLNEHELQFYVFRFQRGMRGPLSYYRTTKMRFEEEKEAQLPAHLLPNLPVLFMYGTKDATCPPSAVQNAHKFISRLNTAQDRVTTQVLRFLSSLGSAQQSRM